MPTTTLYVRQANGRYKPAPPAVVTQQAAALLKPKLLGSKLGSPGALYHYIRHEVELLEHEVFGLIYLDNRNRVLETEILFRGTIDGASVHPREVVKSCLNTNAAAVILFHNHPSGEAEPSQADEVITRRLKAALACVEIRLLDHMVIGSNTRVSFAERGLI